MSESGDFDPGYWKGQDFSQLRQDYKKHTGRSYEDATAASKTATDLIPKTIKTNCRRPLNIVCDVTGSMEEWPTTMFSKLPYLELEGQEYLGKDLEICFAAIGDAGNRDTYPLQVRPYTKGLELQKRLKELVIEKGGGGNMHESYELAAYYFLHNTEIPISALPVLIFIGDEAPYEYVDSDYVKRYTYGALSERLSTKSLFQELMKRYSVYLIHKPYGGNRSGPGDEMDSASKMVYNAWKALLGADRIAHLSDPTRVVDVIFGILARETDRIEDFRNEIRGRQRPEQVEVVYRSLFSVHNPPTQNKKQSGASRLHDEDTGTASKPLL